MTVPLKSLHAVRKLTLHYDIFLYLHHGHTHEVEERETLLVSKERIPKTDHILKAELLAQKEHEPPKREELWVHSLLLQVIVQLWINLKKKLSEDTNLSINS